MKIKILHPCNDSMAAWNAAREWVSGEVEISLEQLLWVEPCKWGEHVGMRIYYMFNKASQWVFTVEPFKFF